MTMVMMVMIAGHAMAHGLTKKRACPHCPHCVLLFFRMAVAVIGFSVGTSCARFELGKNTVSSSPTAMALVFTRRERLA